MATLKERAVYGVKWSAASTFTITLLKYIKLALLARLLIPEDFGLLAMLLVVVGLGQIFSDMGISLAIIWKQDATKEELSSLYWFNIFTGIVISCAVFFASPLVAGFYHEPRLKSLVMLMSSVFLISSVGIPFQMILQKELLFKRLSESEIAATAIGTIATVVLAFLGIGVYALVWGQIIDTTARAIILTLAGWRSWHPSLRLKAKELKPFIRFGVFNLGERLLNFLYTNVDYIIIGKFLGGEMLGIYTLSYQLVIEPFSRINPILTRVAFPVFSRKQGDDAALNRGYCELSAMVAFLTFPILVFTFSTSPLFVPLILGSKWIPAVSIIRILVILGAIRAMINPLGSVLYAKGRTDLAFYWNLIAVTGNTLVFWYMVRYGLYAIAWSENATTFIYYILSLLILRKVIRLSYQGYFSALRSPFIANIGVGGILYLAYILLRNTLTSNLALLIFLIILGIALYATYVALFEKRLFKEYWALLLQRNVEEY
jgi:O-antigen/teichoic acid export membrane protein